MEGRRSRAERRRRPGRRDSRTADPRRSPSRPTSLVVPMPARLRRTRSLHLPDLVPECLGRRPHVRRRSDRRRRQPRRPAVYGWTIDATAPQTTLGSRPTSKTTASTAIFRFAANEAASAFECKLDAGRFVPCASPKRYARLRRSLHTFSVRAIDAADNRDATPASHRWTVGLAKAASALISPAAGARIASPPLLRWRRVARASYYNVQVFRGGVSAPSVADPHALATCVLVDVPGAAVSPQLRQVPLVRLAAVWLRRRWPLRQCPWPEHVHGEGVQPALTCCSRASRRLG